MTMHLKRFCLVFLGLVMLSVVSGCSTAPQIFDDQDLHFKLLNHQSLNGEEVYTIEISSTSPMELTHLTMYLSYPIKTSNGSKWNPFSVEGQTNEPTVNLEKGQSTQFTFDAPIRKVFGDSKLLDFKEPECKLNGYWKEGNKEIPFGMSGDLGLFLELHK